MTDMMKSALRWALAGLALVIAMRALTAPAQADILGDVLSAGANVLSGGLLGGLLRLAPEVLKLFTAKADRDHEFRMAQLAAQNARDAQTAKLDEIRVQAAGVAEARGLDALVEALRGQARPTGFRAIDAISSSVRPMVTYWWLLLYSAVKVSVVITLVGGGEGLAAAALKAWTAFDEATLGGIINFWFLDRVLSRRA